MSSVLANLAHVAKSRDPSIDQRRVPRVLVDMVSHINFNGRSYGARIINISPLGLMCRTEGELLIGQHVSVWLPIVRDMQAEVRWAEDKRIGMEFRQPIEPRLYDAMLSLIPPRQTAW
ncbi:PilZ domain-containing protein [Sphingobium sp. DC-2]|uniref:PilZ domain-containing protein n=1 Tax=Sphingobium sp. DC-2 TaxID=1303256 RepID=UPI0004C3552F|nr:PilZ domain-containing protein [Sphingobium sp. DC-2]